MKGKIKDTAVECLCRKFVFIWSKIVLKLKTFIKQISPFSFMSFLKASPVWFR